MVTKAILEKVNLPRLISSLRRDEPEFCFKLILCLPTLEPESPYRPFCEMIKKKLKGETLVPLDLTWLLSLVLSSLLDGHRSPIFTVE